MIILNLPISSKFIQFLETQVLAKFEGFPAKKLEILRAAATLYLKLEETTSKLENWKVMPPLDQHLSKYESHFNKVSFTRLVKTQIENFSGNPVCH